MEGYLSEQTTAGGIIFLSTIENGKLIFDNSAAVINNHSEIALHSIETLQNTGFHQDVSVFCSCLSTVDGVLRHFFVTHKRPHTITIFDKLHFRPVGGNHQRIYFECSNTAVNLQHILLIHRYKSS